MEGGEKLSPDEPPTSNFPDLTPVCLAAIFRLLPISDFWKGAMLVCKSWLYASRDPFLFESLDLEPDFGATGGGRPDVEFWWTPEFERRVDGMVRVAAECGGRFVKEVRVRHCSDAAVVLLSERCANLQVLSLRSSMNVTDESLARIASCCPLLKELDISNCYEVSFKSLELIGRNCPKLTVLKRNLLNWLDASQHSGVVPSNYLNSCPQDGDVEATMIARFMPNLRHLELRFSKLSTSGLSALYEGCQGLEYLDLDGCAHLTGRDLMKVSTNLPNLRTLRKPNFYIPRSAFQAERYGHWRLYDDRFQTNVFRL